MKKWLSQTSTKTALGTALATASAVATGQIPWQAGLFNLLPVLYGAVVNDKPSA